MRRLRLPSVVIFDLDGTLTKPVLDFNLLRQLLTACHPRSSFATGDLLDSLDQLSPRSKVKADDVIHKFEEEGRKNFAFSAGAVELLRYLGKSFVG
jgi:phosphoserine phosphatase